MKKILLMTIVFMLSGCAAELAGRDCTNLGYVKGSKEFTECAERQLNARREREAEREKQEAAIAIEREKASAGLFGRIPVCNTISYGSNLYAKECK